MYRKYKITESNFFSFYDLNLYIVMSFSLNMVNLITEVLYMSTFKKTRIVTRLPYQKNKCLIAHNLCNQLQKFF